MSRLLQLQAAGGGGGGGGVGLPPGFPGLGLPPAVTSGAAGLLAGLPPSSASPAALAHMMAGAARLPGPPGHLPPTAELYSEKEKELAKLSALPGPLSALSGHSEDRNVSLWSE